jgi:Domain of unknown function (DUF4350)
MDPTVKRLYQFLIIGGVGVLLLILTLATPALLNNEDFSLYNAGWNGCSDIAIKTYQAGKFQPTFYLEENELTIGHRSFAEYSLNPLNSTILLIGPRADFSSQESTYLSDFLTRGGMVLLADDFGNGNNLLEQIGSPVRFSGQLLLDLSFEKSAYFATLFEFSNRSHPLVTNVSHILGNYPSSLVLGANVTNVTVVVNSTKMSWLDANLNGQWDAGEAKGSFPILAIERYGSGTLVLFSDPSLFINSMKTQLNNSVFRDDFLRYLYTGRDAVIIDESHRNASMLFHVAYFFPTQIGNEVKGGIVLLAVGAFLVGFTSVPQSILKRIQKVLSRGTKTLEVVSVAPVIDEVMLRHPSWSRKKLEEIVQRRQKS